MGGGRFGVGVGVGVGGERRGMDDMLVEDCGRGREIEEGDGGMEGVGTVWYGVLRREEGGAAGMVDVWVGVDVRSRVGLMWSWGVVVRGWASRSRVGWTNWEEQAEADAGGGRGVE